MSSSEMSDKKRAQREAQYKDAFEAALKASGKPVEDFTVLDLPIWEDFPFKTEIPPGMELRRSTVEPYLWSLFHPGSGKHVDGVYDSHYTSSSAFWQRVFACLRQVVRDTADA